MIKKIEKEFENLSITAMLIAILTATVITKSTFEFYVVPTGSMLPTLSIGEFQLGKIIRSETDLHRGDIVTFNTERGMVFVKRLIGMPGDTIEINDGVLYLNGAAQVEEYLMDDPFPMPDYGPYTVPEGHYFMMGDNRNNSGDSRVIGSIPYDALRSRVIFHCPTVLPKLLGFLRKTDY